MLDSLPTPLLFAAVAVLVIVGAIIFIVSRRRTGRGTTPKRSVLQIQDQGPFVAGIVRDVQLIDPATHTWEVSVEVLRTEEGPRSWPARFRTQERFAKHMTSMRDAVLPLAYDPADPETVYVTGEDRANALCEQVNIDLGLTTPADLRARAEGTEAHAVVTQLEPTGVSRHGRDQYQITVALADFGAPGTELIDPLPEVISTWRELSRTVFLMPAEAPLLRPGTATHVRYLPGTDIFALTTTNA